MTSKKPLWLGASTPPTINANTSKPRKPNTGVASSPRTAPGAVSKPGAQPQELQPLPTFNPKGLTPLQHRFCQEYLCDVEMNATQAYMRASPKVTYESARVEGCRLLANPNVVREIQRLMDERSAITGITADRVLFKLWERATADARELVEYRIGSCRYCWGIYNQYQYTDAEFSAAQDKHIREEAARAKKDPAHEPAPFPERGGCGYAHDKPPNPECPECWGRGHGEPVIHDTRHYSDAAKSLYAGVKMTKEGCQVLMHDQTEALQLIGRHLGMWNDKIKVETENPLFALIQQIQEAHSTVPIVHDDPELRRPGAPGGRPDIDDVEAKSAPGAHSPIKPASKWRPA